MKRLQTNGVETAYFIDGAGPPLLLVGGGSGHQAVWKDIIPFLKDDFTVVTYDQRDAGDTRSTAADYTIADLADDAAALIKGLGYDKVHVWGSSFGGAICQELALRHPEVINRLVLSVTFSSADALADAPQEVTDLARRANADPSLLVDSVKLYLSQAGRNNPETVERTVQAFRASQSTDEQHARRRRALSSFDVRDRVSSIKTKTLVLAVQEDTIISPDHSWRIARAIPNSSLMLVPDVGHLIAIEEPMRTSRVLKMFLLP